MSRGHANTFNINLLTPNGSTLSGVAGASILQYDNSDGLDALSFIRPFPFLTEKYLKVLPQDTCKVSLSSGGNTIYESVLISGSISSTIRGLPEGFTAATQQVDYTFGPDGRLHSIHRHSTGETEILEYIDDAKDPRLAIPKSFASGGWVLHSYEIYPEGRPDLFTPEAVTARARDMFVAYNERQSEMSQTPEAKRQLARSIEQLGGDSTPLRTTRFALILTGLIVVAVGSLAWWRNRS